MVIQLLLILTLILIITLLNSRVRKESFQNSQKPQMGLYSYHLYNNGPLLDKYTCKDMEMNYGNETSPGFYWRNLPLGTASLALTMEDTTNSDKITHWIVWSIMGNSELTENDRSKLIGINDFNYQGYTTPCKEDKTKQFTFTLYALDILSIPELDVYSTSKNELLTAIRPHILETATMVTYL